MPKSTIFRKKSPRAGHYVYRLIDPRNGETFYVGKGRGNRVFQHVRASDIEGVEDEDAVSLKMSRIRAILGAGLNVIHVIHRHEIPDGRLACGSSPVAMAMEPSQDASVISPTPKPSPQRTGSKMRVPIALKCSNSPFAASMERF